MSQEIERKFLVTGDGWRPGSERVRIRQGYLATRPTVRIRTAGDQGFITIKGAPSGIVRAEYEYKIPLSEASEMLDTLCQRPLIDKWRHRVTYAGLVWEVDEFLAENAGLIVAEVELTDAAQSVDLPAWVGLEVSDDPRYSNAALSQRPYATW